MRLRGSRAALLAHSHTRTQLAIFAFAAARGALARLAPSPGPTTPTAESSRRAATPSSDALSPLLP